MAAFSVSICAHSGNDGAFDPVEVPTHHSLCAGVPCAPYSPVQAIKSVSTRNPKYINGPLDIYVQRSKTVPPGHITVNLSCVKFGLVSLTYETGLIQHDALPIYLSTTEAMRGKVNIYLTNMTQDAPSIGPHIHTRRKLCIVSVHL